jgi:hypothetical protein
MPTDSQGTVTFPAATIQLVPPSVKVTVPSGATVPSGGT